MTIKEFTNLSEEEQELELLALRMAVLNDNQSSEMCCQYCGGTGTIDGETCPDCGGMGVY
jgi:RecJ-like exonuclease